MSDDTIKTVVAAIMKRATAASGTAVFVDAVVLRDILTPLERELAEAREALERLHDQHLIDEGWDRLHLENKLRICEGDRERGRVQRDALVAELAEARASEKRAWDEAAQARIDGAENIVAATEDLRAEVEAAVRWTCNQFNIPLEGELHGLMVDAVWSRYQKEKK